MPIAPVLATRNSHLTLVGLKVRPTAYRWVFSRRLTSALRLPGHTLSTGHDAPYRYVGVQALNSRPGASPANVGYSQPVGQRQDRSQRVHCVLQVRRGAARRPGSVPLPTLIYLTPSKVNRRVPSCLQIQSDAHDHE